MKTLTLRCRRLLLVLILVVGIAASFFDQAEAAVPVEIYVGPNAPKLERLAADELTAICKLLFADVDVVQRTQTPKAATQEGFQILVGSPETNPVLKEIVGDNWRKLSDQGVLLKSYRKKQFQGVVVGGGSPVATLWAAYELGHHFGVRYLLHEDIYPKEKVAPKFDGINVLLEPTLKTRTWRTINDFAIGPEAWGLADHKKLLKQLAKLKYNRVMLSVYPWQPFVHYEFGGVKKKTALLWYGEKFRVDGDTPGRSAFGGAKYFENPDFAGLKTYDEMIAAGRMHMQGIIDAAHELGMSVGVSISPLEFPKEFEAVLPGARKSIGLNGLMIAPGAKQSPDDQSLRGLVKTKIRAYLETYTGIDALYLNAPEHPGWSGYAEAAWKKLGAHHDLGDVSLEILIDTARKRKLIATGQRGVNSVKGNIVMLAFLNSILSDPELLIGKNGRRVEPVIAQVDSALYGLLDRILPKGTSALHFVDYTARRVVENRELLAKVRADQVPSSLILTLADDNVGVLPQSAVRRIETLVGELQSRGWQGFTTRYWMLTELDPTVYYLSRASFDSKVTARSAHDDLFVAISGSKAASDRLWLAFGHIEAATELIDKNNIGFTFPVKGMMMKHYRSDPLPKWWDKVNEHYTQSMIELYRSHGAVDPRAQTLLFYYAKRSEYVLSYLACVKETRLAAIAQKKGETEKAVEHLGTAVESLYGALITLRDIARDQSDRGLIAVLTSHAYRPLVAEYERLAEAVDAESDTE